MSMKVFNKDISQEFETRATVLNISSQLEVQAFAHWAL